MATPAEIKKQVQVMLDAGKSEEEIGKYISDATSPESINTSSKRFAQPVSPNEPGTFGGGFAQSLESGEALGAGLRGLKGFGEGAILDLPATLAGGLGFGLDMLTDAPGTIVNTIKGIPAGLRKIDETFTKAGSDPEGFGELMGQTMGQPLVMSKIPKALQVVGKIEQKYQPVSGFIPSFGLRHLRNMYVAENAFGKALEGTGKFLENPFESFRNNRGTTPPSRNPFQTNTSSQPPVTKVPTTPPGRLSMGAERTGSGMSLAGPEPFLKTKPSSFEQFSTEGITPAPKGEFPKEVNIPIKEGQIVRKPLNVGGTSVEYGPSVEEPINHVQFTYGIDENGNFFVKPRK